MGIFTAKVKATDLDIVKDMVEELEWLRFFYKEAECYFANPLSAYVGIKYKFEQGHKQSKEEDLNGMC